MGVTCSIDSSLSKYYSRGDIYLKAIVTFHSRPRLQQPSLNEQSFGAIHLYGTPVRPSCTVLHHLTRRSRDPQRGLDSCDAPHCKALPSASFPPSAPMSPQWAGRPLRTPSRWLMRSPTTSAAEASATCSRRPTTRYHDQEAPVLYTEASGTKPLASSGCPLSRPKCCIHPDVKWPRRGRGSTGQCWELKRDANPFLNTNMLKLH